MELLFAQINLADLKLRLRLMGLRGADPSISLDNLDSKPSPLPSTSAETTRHDTDPGPWPPAPSPQAVAG